MLDNLSAAITKSAIFRIALVSFLLIQPFKIASAILGFNFNIGLIVCFIPYFFFLLKFREYLKPHLVVLAIQVLLAAISYGLHGVVTYDSSYLLFFIFSPHFALLVGSTFEMEKERLFTRNAFFIYTVSILVFSLISIFMHEGLAAFLDNLNQVFGWANLNRQETLARWKVLDALNIGKNVFGLSEYILEGVALSIFPLVFITAIFVFNWKLDVIVSLTVFLGAAIVIIKNSRGEMLYLITFLIIAFLSKLKPRAVQVLAAMSLILPFFQLFFKQRFLNGRHILNQLFADNQSLLGKGIGYSRNEIIKLTKGEYGSFHNIHYEIVVNFGWIVYSIAAIYFIYSIRNFKARIALTFVSMISILLTTNYELFDVYFAFVIGLFIAVGLRGNEKIQHL